MIRHSFINAKIDNKALVRYLNLSKGFIVDKLNKKALIMMRTQISLDAYLYSLEIEVFW